MQMRIKTGVSVGLLSLIPDRQPAREDVGISAQRLVRMRDETLAD